jgi:hypothetical protein
LIIPIVSAVNRVAASSPTGEEARRSTGRVWAEIEPAEAKGLPSASEERSLTTWRGYAITKEGGLWGRHTKSARSCPSSRRQGV